MTDKKQNKKKKSKTKTKDAPLKTPVSLDDVRYTEDKQIVIINNIQPPVDYTPELRTISLYGDISERKGAEVVAALLYLENNSIMPMMKDPEDPESETVLAARPINMYVSTHGGIASDMFSILDVMDMVKQNTCDIHTYGVGKVMSAGVPILAAGTPGKRKVGRNCRIMLHNVLAGAGGTIFNMENELEEIKWVQDSYIEALASRTKMTKAKIKKLLKTQRDVYISAEEAIKLGIADEII
jgi:ATP-dependent Clp protease protease subunit|tara:strand:- start:3454 stop:4173 length:720 start_codon:yes stop_codon:yes gene_type:complete